MGTPAYRRGMRSRVVNLFLAESQLLDDRALSFLVSQEDPIAVSRRVLESVDSLEIVPLVLGLSDVRICLGDTILRGGSTVVALPSGKEGDSAFMHKLPEGLAGGYKAPTIASLTDPASPVAPARRIDPPAVRTAPRVPPMPAPVTHVVSSAKRAEVECSVDILMDITGDSTCSGCINDFSRYFQDRFTRLKRLISHRREMMGSVPIASISNRRGDVKTIGMVMERQTTSKGGVVFEIEDESGRIKALASGKKEVPTDIVTDEVVGIVGTINPKGDMLYTEQLVRPEIPVRRRTHMTERDVNVAFAADIHVGSNTFLDTQWNRFMDFLNGRLDNGNGTKSILDTLEVLIVPGDVVDGIGVFPGQQDELLISDIYRQYEALAELLKEVPDHI